MLLALSFWLLAAHDVPQVTHFGVGAYTVRPVIAELCYNAKLILNSLRTPILSTILSYEERIVEPRKTLKGEGFAYAQFPLKNPPFWFVRKSNFVLQNARTTRTAF